MTPLERRSPMQPAEETVRPGGLRPGHLRKQLGLLDSEARGPAPPVCQPMKAMVWSPEPQVSRGAE